MMGADDLEAALRELESAVVSLRQVRGRGDEEAWRALDAAMTRLETAKRLVGGTLRSLR